MSGGSRRGDYHQELVDLFAELRATAGRISMRAVARASGLSVSHVSKVLGGTSIPTGPVAAMIAAALGGRAAMQSRARDLAELADDSRRRTRIVVTPVVRPTSGDGAAVREWLERLAQLQESRPSWVRALGGPPDIARSAAIDYVPAKLLVLFGPPGAGKSSWARVHVAGLAQTAIDRIDAGRQPVIPLLVNASEMARRLSGSCTTGSHDPRVATIEECLAGMVFLDAGQYETVSAHLLSLLRDGTGGFAVVIDGADEAGENGIRHHLLPLLDLWQRTLGSAIVVTSRDDPRYRLILENYAGTSDKERCSQHIRPLSYKDLNSLAVAWLGTAEAQRWLNEVFANPMNRPRPGVYQHNNLVDMMANADFQSAGVNRHGEGDERALHRKGSAPRWPRVMHRRP